MLSFREVARSLAQKEKLITQDRLQAYLPPQQQRLDKFDHCIQLLQSQPPNNSFGQDTIRSQVNTNRQAGFASKSRGLVNKYAPDLQQNGCSQSDDQLFDFVLGRKKCNKLPQTILIQQEDSYKAANSRSVSNFMNQPILIKEQFAAAPPRFNLASIYEKQIQASKRNDEIVDSGAKTVCRNYQIGDVGQWTRKRIANVQEVLTQVFGLQGFRNNQKAIINCTLSGIDLFVCMPTGGGKSLTYQLPTFLQTGLTLVVMPLISLIRDQQQHARSFGMVAFSLTGSVEQAQQTAIYKQMLNCESRSVVVFVTPEKVMQSSKLIYTLDIAYQKKSLKRFVIDQAHCVSTWGKDFRKDYLTLGLLKHKYPSVPLMALTATATQIVKIDIIQRLHIKGCLYFQCSFHRPNLYYRVLSKERRNLTRDIMAIIQKYKGQTGIIYCSSKKDCHSVQDQLQKAGVKAGVYHGDLPDAEKSRTQDLWMLDELEVIVATIAFGMGINKPDVRFVIHYSFPKSLQNYYQQSGRAGRDGQPAQCVLFYRASDRGTYNFLSQKNQHSSAAAKIQGHRHIFLMMRYCEDIVSCRKQLQLEHFGQKFQRSKCDKMCDNCRNPRKYEQFVMTKEGLAIARFISKTVEFRQGLTFNQLVQIIQNKRNKSLQNKLKHLQRKGLMSDVHNIQIARQRIEPLLYQLLFLDIVSQKVKQMKQFSVAYLHSKAAVIKQFQKSGKEIIIRIPGSPQVFQEQKPEKRKKNVKLNRLAQFRAKKQIIQQVEKKPSYSTKSDNDIQQFFAQHQCKSKKGSKIINKKQVGKFGYCKGQQQFDQIYSRVKQARKNLFFKLKMENKLASTSNVEVLIPNDILLNLARQLPCNREELKSLKLGKFMELLLEHADFFIPTIFCFVSENEIVKQQLKIEKKKQEQIFQYKDNIVQRPHCHNQVLNFLLNQYADSDEVIQPPQVSLPIPALQIPQKRAFYNAILEEMIDQDD